jgi:hypothetical protein
MEFVTAITLNVARRLSRMGPKYYPSKVNRVLMNQPDVPQAGTSVPATQPASTPPSAPVPEHGGRPGPEPTRYGDWEKNGRCIDF